MTEIINFMIAFKRETILIGIYETDRGGGEGGGVVAVKHIG